MLVLWQGLGGGEAAMVDWGYSGASSGGKPWTKMTSTNTVLQKAMITSVIVL